MAISCGFFDARNLDRVYTAENFTNYLSSLICDGILDSYGQCFAISPVGGFQVRIGTGQAWIKGHYFRNDTPYVLDLSEYADESLPRYVIVGIFCDTQEAVRDCQFIVRAGTAAVNPEIPHFTDNDARTHLTLCQIRLAGGSSGITASNITDCRADENLCGYCKCILGKCKVSEILSSLAQYNAKVTELTKKISDQQSQIADMQAKLEDFTSDMVAAGQCGEDVYYIQYADGSLLLRGTGATYDYELNGNISVFKNNTDIKSVTIGSGITRIGDYLFYKCYNMTSIALPSTLTEIGSHSVSPYDDNLYVAHGLTALTIPTSVRSIEKYAFSHNAITELLIPSNVTTIGDYAFSKCVALETVRIESSLIGSFMFTGCNSLNSFTISANCKTIGENVFSYCSSLRTITYEGSLEQWAAITKPNNWIQTGDHQHNGYLQKIQCLDGYLEYDNENYVWNEVKA